MALIAGADGRSAVVAVKLRLMNDNTALLAQFTVAEYGTERRTTVEMSPSYLRACGLFAAPAAAPISAEELSACVPELAAADARQLCALLLDVGFLRAA